ncbi:MAG: hypothetical protein HYZ89_07535 [Candidatus Omnitrophica bacterium]|nr:hypothetical protein [Candidatus Omnitrophota bacterium]
MSSFAVIDELIQLLQRRYGKRLQAGRSSRLWKFGTALTCSMNYSKELRGPKFFFGLSQEVVSRDFAYPETALGGFVLLVCGTAQNVLVLPRTLMVEMLEGVPTRKVDVYLEDGTYILQTTQHPKLNVTEYLNAFPQPSSASDDSSQEANPESLTDRSHVKFQSALIDLGQAEGCSVWVPPNDRGLSFKGRPFSKRTIQRLPNFGFEENTRRIVQNIDVLWLVKNVIRRAFEVESTTLIYSGLLRLNDLVLAQPNTQIALYIVTSRSRRPKVFNQLIRPSFHSLIPQCEFLAFEEIEEQLQQIERMPLDRGARVTGLVKGERFQLPEHYVYPSGI